MKAHKNQEHTGIWIDHREAIIVVVKSGQEELHKLDSQVNEHVRYSGSSHTGLKDFPAEDQQDRRYLNFLNEFYDEVISVVRQNQIIHLFGPGEAKLELQKRFEHAGLAAKICSVETTDKMTEPQIRAKVKQINSLS